MQQCACRAPQAVLPTSSGWLRAVGPAQQPAHVHFTANEAANPHVGLPGRMHFKVRFKRNISGMEFYSEPPPAGGFLVHPPAGGADNAFAKIFFRPAAVSEQLATQL